MRSTKKNLMKEKIHTEEDIIGLQANLKILTKQKTPMYGL